MVVWSFSGYFWILCYVIIIIKSNLYKKQHIKSVNPIIFPVRLFFYNFSQFSLNIEVSCLFFLQRFGDTLQEELPKDLEKTSFRTHGSTKVHRIFAKCQYAFIQKFLPSLPPYLGCDAECV